jgi:hypothetical protein
MKKLTDLLLITFLLTAAGSLYAEITIGASVDMAIIPYQLILNEDTEPVFFGGPEKEEIIMGAGAGRNLSGQGVRARLDVRASHEDLIGMRARIQARTDGVAIEDYLQAWWKPLPWMRVDAGRFLDDRLRGKLNDLDERMNAYTVRMYDADAIFTRFRTHWKGQAGIMLGVTPPGLENLWVGALLYDLSPFTAASMPGTTHDAAPDLITTNDEAWHRVQIAAAYTIPNIGLVRLQYFGAKPFVDIEILTDEVINNTTTTLASYSVPLFKITAPRIEAAFAYTGIPGLTVDIGGKLPLPFDKWETSPPDIFEKEDETLLDPIYRTYREGLVWQAPYQASLGVKYRPSFLEPLEFAGRIDSKFLGYMKGYKTEVHFAPEINIHVWPSWDFSFARLILNFGYEWIGATYDNNKILIGEGTPVALNGGNRVGVGISLQKNFLSNCYVKGGVAWKFAGTVNGIQEKAVLTIPLYVEYTF